MADYDLLDDVLRQMQEAGLAPETPLVTTGKRTRCPTDTDKSPEKTGWYVIYEHRTSDDRTIFCGAFGDWRSGEKGDWQKIKPKGGKISAEDRAVMKKRAEDGQRKAAEAEAKKHKTAARRAAGMWKKLPEKGKSLYLEVKRVVGFGLRYSPKSGAALVPMRNVRGDIVGLQVLYPEKQANTGRNKTYWPPGVEKEGAFHLIGPDPEPGEPLLVCEGYATGASLHMATQLPVAVCFDAGNLMPVAKAMHDRFPGRPMILCADDDWKTVIRDKPTNVGKIKAENAAIVVDGQVVLPIFDTNREDGWSDFNDLHVAEGLDAVRRQVLAVVRPPADGGWKDELQRTNTGALVPHAVNVKLILANDARWAGVIGEDIFSSKTVKRRATPYGGKAGEWSDLDDVQTSIWLAERYGLRVKSLTVLEAVGVVAHEHQFHPVREYLDGLVWDKTPRLRTWLRTYLGAEPLVADPTYIEAVGMRWMISAVARVMVPGTKADCVLILEGAQGEGKSTALGILGGEWFMDSPFPLGDKEAFQQIRGKWIIELGELDAFNKAESTKAKQFFSASKDTFRASYARRTVDVLRQCVFAGTTNQEDYLKDPTGNRRYWPVWCRFVDAAGLIAVRDQLWAEAYALYQSGESFWPHKEEAALFEAEQDARFAGDMWEHPICKYLETYVGETITGDVLLRDALMLDPGHWGKPEQMRLGHIMHRLEWRKRRQTAAGKFGRRGYAYERPDSWKVGQAQLGERGTAF